METLSLSLRQRKLIHYLQHHTSYITGDELAGHLNVSARTIRNDVIEINNVLNPLEIRIASKRSSGYKLEADNNENLNQLSQTSESYLSRDDRVRHIAFRLCLSEEPINLYDLEDEMFISHTTLEHDLMELRRQYVLPAPHIRLHRSKNNIYFGSDERKRRAILNRLFTDNWNYNARGNAYYQYQYLEEDMVNLIMPETQAHLRKYNIVMEDINMVILNLMIAISYYRMSTGHILTETKPLPFEDTTALHATKDILDTLEYKLTCTFPPAERNEIYLHISCGAMIDASKLNFASVDSFFDKDIIVLANRYIEEIKNVYNIDFSYNEDFYIIILQFFRTLGLPIHNYNTIQTDSDIARSNLLIPFEIAFLFQPIALEYYGNYLDYTELLYLAFSISGALAYYNHTAAKIKTVVMSHLNLPQTWDLKNKILNRFKEFIDLTSLLPIYIKDNYDFSKIDLIVTTVTKKITDDPNCKIIIVSPFLTSQDQEKLEKYITQKQIQRLFSPSLPSITDLLENAFWHEQILVDNYISIAELLANDFINSGYVSPRFLNNILQRESILTFAFSPSVVLMYSLIPSNRTCLSIATLEHRIKWNSYKVRTVIMAAIRPEDTTLVFRLINDLYYNSFNPNDIRFLKTKEELLGFFENL